MFSISTDKLDSKRNVGKFFLEIHFISLFPASPIKLSEFGEDSVILFQTKVFGRYIKNTTLSKLLNINTENMLQRLSRISVLLKPPCLYKKLIYYRYF